MSSRFLKYYVIFGALGLLTGGVILYNTVSFSFKPVIRQQEEIPWYAPNIDILPQTPEAAEIRYGRDLIVHTSKYWGPKGMLGKISNGMECQNCHLDAGTRPYGNSFGAVASTYPKYRDRSGIIESIEYRVNECMERSLHGEKIDTAGKEMKALVAYFKWLGKSVPRGEKPPGTGIIEIGFLERAADPEKGRHIYTNKCQSCHGAKGEGLWKPDSSGFFYPPLWGENSYNVSAGIYRLTRMAGFVKHNMPFTASQTNPQLTDEEAWDVAAFVNSQQRPEKFFAYDWKKISSKPLDYPFGPFADSFSEQQHKYGPFPPMKKSGKK